MSLVSPPSVAMAEVLGVVGLVLVTTYVYVLVELCFLRQRRLYVASVAALLVGIVVHCWMNGLQAFLSVDPEWDLLGLAGIVSRMPAVVSIGVLALGFALAVRQVLWLRGVRRGRITPDSVKEALDALPDGVCFSRPDGSPLLVNAQMDELAHDLFGTHITNERRLWERVNAADCLMDATSECVPGSPDVLLRLPDACGWVFRRSDIETGSVAAVETIATDVSEELALASELERRNRRLAEVRQRLRAYSADLVRLTREEEVLAAKVRVHDEVGRALVALRAYERQDEAHRDREALLTAWQRTMRLMQVALEEDDTTDRWLLLNEAAQAVDVRLVVTGEMPPQGSALDLLVVIVHECLNNAVRHAGAHEVAVSLREEAGELLVRVTNDGTPPTGPVDETGGLANLRAAIERAHGTMLVEWSPQYAVTVRLELEGD